MTRRYLNIVTMLLVAAVVLGGCYREDKGPPDEDEVDRSTGFSGTFYFAGLWDGDPGSYSVNLETLEATKLSDTVATFMQTSGEADKLLLVDAEANIQLVDVETTITRTLGSGADAFLAPNGRKYFVHDAETGELMEHHIEADGSRLVVPDGKYGAYSPDMAKIAYLSTAGLVIANPDNSEPIFVNLLGFLHAGERFVPPPTGDFFPRWTTDGKNVAAAVVIANEAGTTVGGLIAVADRDGALITFLANEPVEPAWTPDGHVLYYVSANSIYSWDLVGEENRLISGGSNSLNNRQRVNAEGTYLAYVRTDYEGETGVFVWNTAEDKTIEAVRRSTAGARAVAWPGEPYCAGNGNQAPRISTAKVAVDGELVDNPLLSPNTVNTLQVKPIDEDCNLAGGVLMFSLGGDDLTALELSLPSGTGCNGEIVEYALPRLPAGAHDVRVVVEDLCGAQSDAAIVPMRYVLPPAAAPDDDDDDSVTDDDTVGDDDDDDDDNNDNNDNNDDNDDTV
jgi:hypothetical protein